MKELQSYKNISKIINVYGPTETTIWSTESDLTNAHTVTLGYPIQNTQCYVINTNQQLKPLGCKGELIIGGNGVTKGYFDQIKTQEKFISLSLPVKQQYYGLFYKTGDVVSLSSSHELLYHGRQDDQVKIRGYRIELSEIVNVLEKYDSVKTAVCLAIKKQHFNQYTTALIAFIVPKNNLNFDNYNTSNLYSFAKKYLPTYMIPSLIIPLQKIPTNQNGKVDIQALRALYIKTISNDNTTVQRALSDTEKLISQVWCNLLEIETVNIDSSFYTLGGNSLLIPVMISSLIKVFSKTITIRDFIQNPSISSLAAFIDSNTETK